MVKTSAPGNLFFGGEHGVVYNHSALITSIDMRTRASIRKSNDSRIILSSENYGKIDEELNKLLKKRLDYYQNKMDPARDLIKYFQNTYGLDGFKAYIESDIPRTAGGLSSSTAFLCSFLKALDYEFNEKTIETKDYFYKLLPFQAKIHGGKASGVEIISSSLGGFNKVQKTQENKIIIEPIKSQPISIVIGDTGIERRTSEPVLYVKNGWEVDRGSYEEIFDKIESLVIDEVKAIKNCDVNELGILMNQNHEILARDLGVSHPKLNKLVDACIRAGAPGAKMTGGGKGGSMFALTNEENQKAIAKTILLEGGIPYITKIGVGGVSIEI